MAEHETTAASGEPSMESVAELRRRLDEQDRRIEALEQSARVRAGMTTAQPAAGRSVDDVRTDRRRLLTGAGLAATAAAAAGIARATPAAAANGDSLRVGYSIDATSPTSLLYSGTSPGANALFSVSDTPFPPTGGPAAIWGWATTRVSVGVRGQSSAADGTGVLATAGIMGGVGLRARGNRAAVVLESVAATPPPSRVDSHGVGEIDIDSTGDTWLCVSSGSPGGWRKLGGPATAGAFHVLGATNRIYDSRPGFAPADVAKGVLGTFQERIIDAKHGTAVPAGATAALLNVTATNTNTAGFLALFKNGIAWPGNSSVNWSSSGLTTANLAVVALDANALFKVRCDGGGVTHFVLDVIGYFR